MLPAIIRRFTGRNFILYDGTEEHITMIREGGGNPIAWFTVRPDISTVPPRQTYRNLYSTIYDAVYLVVTTGNMGRRKVEMGIAQILNSRSNNTGVVILHGYSDFMSTGLRVVVEPYNGGVIVFRMDDMAKSLIETRDALALSPGRDLPSIEIPVQEVDQGIASFTHLASIIKAREGAVPITDEEVPISLPVEDHDELVEYDSLRSWRQRRMLISAVDFLNHLYRTNPVDDVVLLYVGAAPADHVELLANMYADYGITIHLWGEGEYPISESPSASGEYASIFVRPSEYGTDGALDPTKYQGLPVAIISYEAPSETLRLVQQLNPLLTWSNLSVREDERLEFLDGITRLQAWSSTNSMDVGLISDTQELTMYDGQLHHRKMRYFQSIERPRSYASVQYIHDPANGLCTCYDCSREVQVIRDYMQLVEEEASDDAIRRMITDITLASRPYVGRARNERTLWSVVMPRVPASDRHHLVLFHDVPAGVQERLNTMWGTDAIRVSSKSLLELPVQRYNIIMAYADDIPLEEVVRMLKEKEPGTPMLVRDASMGEILAGDIDTVLVDMNTDFGPETSTSGIRNYNAFIQRVALSRIDMSPIQHLALFSMR